MTTTTTTAPAWMLAAPSNDEAMALAAAALADDALPHVPRAQRVAIGRALARLRAVDRRGGGGRDDHRGAPRHVPPGFVVGFFAAQGCEITGSAGSVDVDAVPAVIDAARAGLMIGRAHS